MGGFLYSTILIIFVFKKRDIVSTYNCIQTNFVEWSLKRKMDPNKTYAKNIKVVQLLIVIFAVIVSLIAFSPLISAISDLDDSPLDTHSHWLMYWPKVNPYFIRICAYAVNFYVLVLYISFRRYSIIHYLGNWQFCRIDNLTIYLFVYHLQLVSTFFILLSLGACNIGLLVFLSELNDQIYKLTHGLNEAFEYRMVYEFRSHFIDCIRHHQSIIKWL